MMPNYGNNKKVSNRNICWWAHFSTTSFCKKIDFEYDGKEIRNKVFLFLRSESFLSISVFSKDASNLTFTAFDLDPFSLLPWVWRALLLINRVCDCFPKIRLNGILPNVEIEINQIQTSVLESSFFDGDWIGSWDKPEFGLRGEALFLSFEKISRALLKIDDLP